MAHTHTPPTTPRRAFQRRRHAFAVLFGVTAVASGACGVSDVIVDVNVVADSLLITVDSLSVDQRHVAVSELQLEEGQSLSLSATAINALGITVGDAAVTWGSLNPTVATVSADGVITGVAAGATAITATSGEVTAELPVTVIAP